MTETTLIRAEEVIKELVGKICKQGRAKMPNSSQCDYIVYDHAGPDTTAKYCIHSLAVKPEMRIDCKAKSASTVIRKYGDKIHQPKYQGFPSEMWTDLQGLHDEDFYWNVTDSGDLELSAYGVAKMKSIIKENEK